METQIYHPGLAGVIAAETRLSRVDGLAGELVIGGYAVEDLAAHATFEEVAGLLWQGQRLSEQELAALRAELAALRAVPPLTLTALRAAVAHCPPMDAVQIAASTLHLAVGPGSTPRAQAALLVAALPTIVAADWRLRRSMEPIAPDPQLGHAANFLWMLTGEPPRPNAVRALETYLNTVIDHGLNASTFTARVIISTESDMVSAVVGALGALKGPLHGGAPGPALDTVLAIGTPERAEPVLRAKLERGERLMGFGHRVYKVRDPRALVLQRAAADLYATEGDRQLYALAQHVERTALTLLAEYKPHARLQTNVEFYTALLLHGLGFDPDLFTPTFAMARVGGWTAHCLEQLGHNRIFRPESVYVGETGAVW